MQIDNASSVCIQLEEHHFWSASADIRIVRVPCVWGALAVTQWMTL